ncbi:hypothetical protein SFRURICE_015792 [Spodoptera frugiperda]|nr:hypothetical protein SFRURICE_015792 [Spodoptera frugiperda]
MGNSQTKEETMIVQTALGSNKAGAEQLQYHLSLSNILLCIIVLVLLLGTLYCVYRTYRRCHIYEKLKQVGTYLIKIGPSRREGRILEIKLKEANDIFCKYSKWLLDFENKVKEGTIKSDDFPLYENCRKNFDLLYQEIKILCQPVVKPQNSSNMDSFELTALHLLPYYNYSLLTKPECKKNLIKFILKSRLSQSAKLRLKDDYTSVEALIRDMQIDAAAIQNKLQKTRQNDMPIVDYGKLITELFVDLTISQADGNTECYNILKSINEKQAIKQFSDGFRNRRISTIISARNYSSLKDAIQAAQDEETSSSAAGEVMGTHVAMDVIGKRLFNEDTTMETRSDRVEDTTMETRSDRVHGASRTRVAKNTEDVIIELSKES